MGNDTKKNQHIIVWSKPVAGSFSLTCLKIGLISFTSIQLFSMQL